MASDLEEISSDFINRNKESECRSNIQFYVARLDLTELKVLEVLAKELYKKYGKK